MWETTTDQVNLLTPQTAVALATNPTAATTITVDPSQTYQTMTGFGGAMTDAAAYVINHDMSSSQRTALMSDLFGSSGLNFSFMRLTIGASDFSQSDYTYDDVAPGQTDPSLTSFSIAPAEANVVPLVKQALALNSHLTIMASPWSAPAWMKSSGSLIGGSVNTSAYGAYANYLAKYVTAMGADGVPISLISMQNEPGYSPPDYPGTLEPPASRAAFIGGSLGPTFATQGLKTQILDYDHNWDLPSSPEAVLADATANPYIAGVAWHCYAGDVSAQTTVHNAYPTKDAYFTECTGTFPTNFSGSFDWNMQNLIIGATRNWAKGVLLWNLALDENNGPHTGGCTTCRGIVTVNSTTGAVTKNLEYYALAHISKFVRPGAVRIASDATSAIDTVAFKNTDDGSIVLIALNLSGSSQSFAVQQSGQGFTYTLPSGAAATFVWH